MRPHEPDIHMASEKITPFLENFLDFGYLAGKLSIISSAKISFFSLFTKIQILHVNRVNFLILCADVHMRLPLHPSTCVDIGLTPLPLSVDVINGWPRSSTESYSEFCGK